jgi:proliferating cell nuclear antigen
MTNIFHCKTGEGHIIKILSELQQNIIKNGCYTITDNSINQRIMDNNKRILIDLNLNADKFITFKNKSRTLSIGLNQSHFYKMLKSIKKKDSISLFIQDDRPNDLGIEIIPKEKNRVTVSHIKIQYIQSLDIDLPEGYDYSVIIPSSEFQKMIKDMNNIGSTIIVSSKNHVIKFKCESESIYSRFVEFGDRDDDIMDDYCEQVFDIDILTRIAKIAGLNSSMQIYQKKGLPLLIKSPVGNIGSISLYIKSKDLIEADELEHNSDDE